MDWVFLNKTAAKITFVVEADLLKVKKALNALVELSALIRLAAGFNSPGGHYRFCLVPLVVPQRRPELRNSHQASNGVMIESEASFGGALFGVIVQLGGRETGSLEIGVQVPVTPPRGYRPIGRTRPSHG